MPEHDLPPDPGPDGERTETFHGPIGLPPEGSAVLPRGAEVGRYVVLGLLGAGGMGVVYAGYDPELDRKVALKLLRPERSGGADRLRLLREAQAIARLSHPNVVAVHDAGTWREQVFVAMELVAGRTLRRWLADGPHPWREVLARFTAAGQGLAAAHAAGLVHRDFKPDNVLLGDDGRVRVADFGLARPSGAMDEAASPSPESPPLPSPLSSLLTADGRLLGTPAYMAPERIARGEADARTDQFSFCVALYEALYGERPFAGGSAGELEAAILAGRVRPAPPGTRVPARLRQVLLRGLAVDPAARYPSMAVLLADLAHDPAAARRRWLAAAAVAAVVAALAGGAGALLARRDRVCGGGEAKLLGVWDQEREAAARTAVLATGAAYAADAWRSLERALDRYAAEWADMHRSACEATRLSGEQSEELLDRRMFCLDGRLGELRAVSDLLVRADAQVVARAAELTRGLGELGRCADAAALRARVPPPADPAARSRVEEVRAALARVEALADAGKHAEAFERAQAAAGPAADAGYRPLEAEVLYQVGFLADKLGRSAEAERALFDALVAAEAGGHGEQAALAGAQLAWVVGIQRARPEDGHRWARLAEARVEGLAAGGELKASLLNNLGALLQTEGRREEALAVFERGLAEAERALGPEAPLVASLLSNIGVVYDEQRRLDEALRVSERALAIRRKVLDPDHPDLAKSYNTLGNIHSNAGRMEAAIESYGKSLEIIKASYGARHPLTAGISMNLAITLKDRGRYAEAMALYREALAVVEATQGPEHPMVAMVLANVGELLVLQGDHAEGAAAYRRAIAIEAGTIDAAHPDRAYALKGLGEALLGLGRAAEAVAPLAEAVELRERAEVPAGLLAGARFALARALWESGRDRGRALALARQARDGLAAAGAEAAELDPIDRWLAERGGA